MIQYNDRLVVVVDDMYSSKRITDTLKTWGFKNSRSDSTHGQFLRSLRLKPAFILADVKAIGAFRHDIKADIERLTEYPRPPVIFMADDPVWIWLAKAHDAHAFLLKPFTNQMLFRTLEAAILGDKEFVYLGPSVPVIRMAGASAEVTATTQAAFKLMCERPELVGELAKLIQVLKS